MCVCVCMYTHPWMHCLLVHLDRVASAKEKVVLSEHKKATRTSDFEAPPAAMPDHLALAPPHQACSASSGISNASTVQWIGPWKL